MKVIVCHFSVDFDMFVNKKSNFFSRKIHLFLDSFTIVESEEIFDAFVQFRNPRSVWLE